MLVTYLADISCRLDQVYQVVPFFKIIFLRQVIEYNFDRLPTFGFAFCVFCNRVFKVKKIKLRYCIDNQLVKIGLRYSELGFKGYRPLMDVSASHIKHPKMHSQSFF